MGSRSPVYLLDASIYIFRNYFAMPDVWHNDEGYSLNAVQGYTLFLLKLLDQLQPQRIAACFDESLGQCFRNKIYPDYKQSRALPDDSLAFQLQACKKVTGLLGIKCYAHKRYEADDLIATLAQRMRRSGRPITIISRDKDLAQLIHRVDDCLWDSADDRRWRASEVEQRFGVTPAQLIDYQSLLGDPIDDVPGVPGVGAKTAAKLLQHFDSVDELLTRLDELDSKAWRGGKGLALRLDEHREQIAIARQLVTLETQVPMRFQASDLEWRAPQRKPVQRYLRKIGLDGGIQTSLRNSELLIGQSLQTAYG